VDLAALEPAVRAGGGRVVRTRITAKGRIEREGGQARFRIDGWEDAYVIEADDLPAGSCKIRAGVRFVDDVPQLNVIEE
jgi:hypothetical protein